MPSRSLGTLTLDLVARTAGFARGMDAAERKSAQWRRKVKRNIDDTTRALRRLSVVATGALVGAFGAVVAASVRQENALRQVEQRLISTGNAVGKTKDELAAMAAEFQKVTTFGDEEILETQSKLLTFVNITGDTFERTLEAVLDLSVAMDQDLKSSVVQLGKAINDPVANISALSRVGIQFTESQKETIKSLAATNRLAEAQEIILAELRKEFGGSARAAADTFGGALKQVQNAFGDLLENPDGLKATTGELRGLVEFLQSPETIQAANDLTSALINGFTAVGESIRTTTQFTQGFAEQLASIRAGAAFDDVVRLEQQLDLAQRALNDPSQRIRFFGPGGIIEYWDEDELNAEIKRIEAALEFNREVLNKNFSGRPLEIPVRTTTERPTGTGSTPPSETPSVTPSVDHSQLRLIETEVRQRRAINEEIAKYQQLVDGLKTDEERLTDELKERLGTLQQISFISEEARAEVRQRAIDAGDVAAPAVGGVSPEIAGPFADFQRLNEQTELLQEWRDNELEKFRNWRESELITAEEYNQKELAVAQEHAENLAKIDKARQVVALSTAEETFGSLAGLAKQFAGEQSDAYKILFAAEKAAAIARSIIAIQTALAQASASLPFPANLAAIATVAAQGASIIATITSTAIQGQAHDGLMSVPQTGTYLLEKGERVTTQETSAKLDRVLDNISKGQGGPLNQNIYVGLDANEIGETWAQSGGFERAVVKAASRNRRAINGGR